jgi:hypothetical protein
MNPTRRNRKRDRRAALVLLLLLLGALGLLVMVDRQDPGVHGAGVPVGASGGHSSKGSAVGGASPSPTTRPGSTGSNGRSSGTSRGGTSQLPFDVTGSVRGVVVGAWTPIPITIRNRNSVAITVTGLRASVSGAHNGCDAARNFETRASSAPFTVPAHAQRFAVPRASRPSIRLRDLATDQDPCKRQRFALAFSGRASRP